MPDISRSNAYRAARTSTRASAPLVGMLMAERNRLPERKSGLIGNDMMAETARDLGVSLIRRPAGAWPT